MAAGGRPPPTRSTDEASRKMALVVAAKGRAAGMTRTSTRTAPGG